MHRRSIEIHPPTLLLDREKCMQNIGKMAGKAAARGLALRPHCKTHQSAVIGEWMRESGIGSITVSSFRMAIYFAAAGWKDILVAFPFVPTGLCDLEELSAKARISILLDHPSATAFLKKLSHPVDFYVDVDTGYGRTGIPAEEPASVEELLKAASLCKNLTFRGFYCHAGHSYHAQNREEKDVIHRKAMKDLARLKGEFSHYQPIALYGDTPNCSIQEDFQGADVLTPGNFVLYDLMQFLAGNCSAGEIAVLMACPVAGVYPARRQVVVHGGAVHFSKESMRLDGQEIFGLAVGREGRQWDALQGQTRITGLSQEHGIVSGPEEWIRGIRIGDLLHLYPIHSCLTVSLMKEYRTLEGERIPTMHLKA
jgi:D-serine deaminase-like pyridoxal phosphate-dependent protein